MSVFISYSSADAIYAAQLEQALSFNGIEAWFAPKSIGAGQDFAQCIGKELSPHKAQDEDDRIDEDLAHLKEAPFFILLLSAHSMKSKWVKKELTAAINMNLPMRVLQLDHSTLEDSFAFKLQDVQITGAYHLPREVLESLIGELKEALGVGTPDGGSSRVREERLSFEKIGIFPLASGDPYFSEGDTLRITLGSGSFFLAPPTECLHDPECTEYLQLHAFAKADEVFGEELAEVCRQIPVDDLEEMIEESRRKIFADFLYGHNGCYYNNQKYGISRISRFERTENLAEEPVLRMEMFLTDYFTHRVMKDVCKKLAAKDRNFFRRLDYNHIGAARIFLTSLGINLVLSEGREKVLLTSRSVNAAETYSRHSWSLSIIEGVSISDYDTFKRTVNVRYAVMRGLQEELGVEEEMVKTDTLRFYDLFINPVNLEMGLSCSIELKDGKSMERDVLPLHAKDEELEIAGKRIVDVRALKEFVLNNFAGMLPQAVFTLCVYMESAGIFLLDRMHRNLLRDVTSVIPKDPKAALCGDTYVWGEHYIAVVDGATPKGEMLWDGMRGDVFVSHLIADAIVAMHPGYSAQEAIEHINSEVYKAYGKYGVDFDSLVCRPEG